MPAYWIARARIIDPIAFKKYTDRSPSVIARYGGRFLARGGRFRIMEDAMGRRRGYCIPSSLM